MIDYAQEVHEAQGLPDLYVKKMCSSLTKTGVLHNFCFIMFFPRHMVDA